MHASSLLLQNQRKLIFQLKRCIKFDATFEWQERYHDHIIWDTEEYNQIKDYIIHNPENRTEDCFLITSDPKPIIWFAVFLWICIKLILKNIKINWGDLHSHL
jgi:hypothetical protein